MLREGHLNIASMKERCSPAERQARVDLAACYRLMAFLDVFEHEPLASDSPLWALPNVMLTPHSAGHSDGNHGRVCESFLANPAHFSQGQPLRHWVE